MSFKYLIFNVFVNKVKRFPLCDIIVALFTCETHAQSSDVGFSSPRKISSSSGGCVKISSSISGSK